jgi:hypothetical protein
MSNADQFIWDRIKLRIDRRALAVIALFVAALVGTVIALGTFLFRRLGPLGGDSLATALDSLAQSLPAIGVIVVLVSLLAVWRLRPSASTLLATETSEEIQPFAAPDGMAAHLHDAVQAQYRGEKEESATEVHELLVDGAVRAIRTHRGVDAQTARRAVESGTWTDDPIAAAFLGEQTRYPPRDWLYGLVDPGGAYQRRVRRTLDAIDAIKRSSWEEEG